MNTNKDAKRIMIYGDSLTWGRIANQTGRFDPETRYTGVLQNTLGNSYEVIEEGLRGRMAADENTFQPYRDGLVTFPSIFLSHLPLDLLIIFLGTNDTNSKANKNSEKIASDLSKYVAFVPELSKSLGFNNPKLLFVIPPIVNEKYFKDVTMFDGAYERMQDISTAIATMAQVNDCFVFDSNDFIKVGNIDGVHIDADANKLLGNELAKFIKNLAL